MDYQYLPSRCKNYRQVGHVLRNCPWSLNYRISRRISPMSNPFLDLEETISHSITKLLPSLNEKGDSERIFMESSISCFSNNSQTPLGDSLHLRVP